MAGKRPKGSPEQIGRLLHGAAVPPVLAARLKELEIWRQWERAVGPAVAARTRPLRISGGVLTVVVASAPWMQQLSFMKSDLRQSLNALIGEELVREIVLKAGRLPAEPSAAEERPPVPQPLTLQQQEWISSQLTGPCDSELRQELQELMECHLRHLKAPSGQ